jgi:hypothetical protein
VAWLGGLVAAFLLSAPPVTSGATQTAPLELAVKAAFVYNFVKLVTWPDLPHTRTPTLRICVLADEDLADALDTAVRDKQVMGRPLAVGRFSSVDEVVPCAVLFVGRGMADQLPLLLLRLRGWPVLTVSDAAGFAGEGGAIGLFADEGRVRFEISVASVRAAGLQVSSKLLRLSRPALGPPCADCVSRAEQER